jgi:hypothetical protein
MLYADERYVRSIQRDWWLLLAAGSVAMLGILAVLALGDTTIWMETPGAPAFYLFWTLVTIVAFSWTAFMLFIGLRFLDFSSRWLQYGQEAVVPFYVLHQPVIVIIAFYVVQWQAGATVKMLAVVLASLLATAGIYELLIRRLAPLRLLFGMKAVAQPPSGRPEDSAPASGAGIRPST